MLVVCSALLAGLVLGIAAWSLLGLGWVTGVAVLFGLLVVMPLGFLACIDLVHRLLRRQIGGASRRTSWTRFRH